MAAVQQLGLFTGKPEKPRIEHVRNPTKPNGYAMRPGTGPSGETCSTCAHCRQRCNTKNAYYKCWLTYGNWTNGRASDVLLRSPACAKWESGKPSVTTLKGNCDAD